MEEQDNNEYLLYNKKATPNWMLPFLWSYLIVYLKLSIEVKG